MNNTKVPIRLVARYLLLWLVVIALFITALPVVAQGPEQTGEPPDGTAKRAPQVWGGGQPAPAKVRATMSEGFEGSTVPPTGWARIQTNPNETWQISDVNAHSGSYYAHVLYDAALLDQDEVLLSPSFTAASGSVALWSKGSLYWCHDTYDNCDLEVWFVNGNWGGGDDVYLGLVDGDWTETWVWSHSTFDFSLYASGNPARIAFRYVGNDGAEIGLDDISINYFNVGPVVYDSHLIDDDNSDQSIGDDDGIVDPGETIELLVHLYNEGSDTATGVSAVLSTSDSYISITDSQENYPDIPGGATRTCVYDFDFRVDSSAPDGHVIHFDLDITASNGGPWSDSLEVPVGVAPAPEGNIYLPIIFKNGTPPSNRVAVVVGIAGYQEAPLGVRAGWGEGNLMYTDEDAIDTQNVLITRGGFQGENVKLLASPYPRGVRADMPYKTTIQDAIVNWLDARENNNTLVVFFFSGHGGYTLDNNGDEADGWDEYIVPYNYPDLDDIILDDELDAWLSVLESNRIVVIIDSCFSGGMIESSSEGKIEGERKGFGGPGEGMVIAEGDGFAKDINKPGRIVLTASSDTEGSWEFSALQNGVFTYYLVEGLGTSSADSNSNGWVSAEEAFSYLGARVDPYVYPRTGEHQNPQLSDRVTGEVDLTQP